MTSLEQRDHYVYQLLISLPLNENPGTSRNLAQVEYFIEKYGMDYSLEQRDEYGHTPSHWMALKGHAQISR